MELHPIILSIDITFRASDSLSTPSDNSQSSNERNLTGVKGHPEQVTPSADGRDSGKCGDNDLRNVLLAHGFSLRFVMTMIMMMMMMMMMIVQYLLAKSQNRNHEDAQ